MKLDISSVVDGKPQHSIGYWRSRVTSEQLFDWYTYGVDIEGQAVAVPLGQGRHVYALLRSSRNWSQSDPAEIMGRLDYGLLLAVRSHYPDSPIERHRVAVKLSNGRRISICQDGNGNILDSCPILVFFEDEADHKSGRSIRLGRHYKLAGHDVIINSIVLSYAQEPLASDIFSGPLPAFFKRLAAQPETPQNEICCFQDQEPHRTEADDQRTIYRSNFVKKLP
jgi:hypothetical protein